MTVYLNDCSNIWEVWFQEASESIVLFSPYFDEIIFDLIEETSLDFKNITLITQLDWKESKTQNIERIFILRKLLNLGVNVLILNRLHAKILIVDWDRALFGSQNFTKYSKGSIEISSEIMRYDGYEHIFEDLELLLSEAWTPTDRDLNDAIGI